MSPSGFVSLKGEEKERYLAKLLGQTGQLAEQLASDPGLPTAPGIPEESRKLHRGVLADLAKELNRVRAAMGALRYISGAEDFHENTGVWREVSVDTESGLPRFDYLLTRLSDVRNAPEPHREAALAAALEDLLFDENLPGNAYAGRFEELTAAVRELDFSRRTKTLDIPLASKSDLHTDLRAMRVGKGNLTPDGMSTERFKLVFTAYNLPQAAYNSCIIILDQDIPMRGTAKDLRMEGKSAVISAELSDMLTRKFWGTPYDLMEGLDSIEALHPKHVSIGVYGPFYSANVRDLSTMRGREGRALRELLEANPDIAFLRYRRDYLSSRGTIRKPLRLRKDSFREDYRREDVASDELAVCDAQARAVLAELTKGSPLKIYHEVAR
ncbi:hypothetical protein J4439_00320 [Candidatus Woesearchaeota archaeon]|nr:hypothetical protein [Candidatus Woesearchaeota archaeon]